jgi:FAD/FMN-containing dehydrogenase
MSGTSYPRSLTRRAFFGATALLATLPRSPFATVAGAPSSTVVNDLHSRLNATRVDAVVQPSSVGELRRVVHAAAAVDTQISLAGGRHAMGGQQFRTGSLLIDMSALNRVLSFDRDAGIVEVEGGIQWPELVAWLARRQQGEGGAWGIVQKQTGADRLSIGGALSANVHGRGLVYRPIIQDVESLVLMGADGTETLCSREQNAELFFLAIGGYGLFGPIVSVRLRLARRRKVERIVELLDVDELIAAFEQRIASGFEFGDFQFATDESDESFLRRGVFSCYRPVSDQVPVPATRAELSEADWTRLAYLAHTDRKQAFDTYSGFYLSTSGQIYWSDTHQMSYYRDDYHVALSQQLGERHASSEMISEIYVPRAALADFMGAASEVLRDASVPLIYGTVRLIERDGESYLAWAREPWACIIFNLHVDHTEAGVQRAQGAFLRLIDAALDRRGSYYLTYHRWARRDQVEAAHPRLASFLRRKRRYDPQERFQSDWYRHYRRMFAAARLG